MKKKNKIIVILGPTASGKSNLAVKIAKRFNGEIISADSRQVYKGLDIGSGKVPKDKNPKFYILNSKSYFYKDIPHYLLDVASPKRTFTVSQYQKLAKKALKDILNRGKLPIICGGTGLYIDSLIYDFPFPNVPPQKKLRKKLENKSCEKLFKQLQKLDPQRAKTIDRFNKRRLVRALEIVISTGKPVPTLNNADINQHNNPRESATALTALKIGIKKSLDELKKLIAERLKKRLKQGLIKEVKNLRQQGISWQRLDNLGLEYRYVSRYLRNLISKKEMIDLINKESWRYAKRQITWFKRDSKIHWINEEKEAANSIKQFLTK